MTDPDHLHLALASDPYYNHHADPVYARRLKDRDHEFSWNNDQYNCLYPMTYSRLNRVVIIIPQTIDLYNVFDSDEAESDVQNFL